jgi:hypothetical protein
VLIEFILHAVELEERVRLVLDNESFASTNGNSANGTHGFTFQPHKEAMNLARDRILSELSPPSDNGNEPWLDTFIKCECLKLTCDEISAKVSCFFSSSFLVVEASG